MAEKKTAGTPKLGDEVQVRYLENPNAQPTVVRGKVTGLGPLARVDLLLTRPDKKGELRLSSVPPHDPSQPQGGSLPRWEPLAS
jgi:hypothetical protein